MKETGWQIPAEIHQEEIEAMQDPIATAVIVGWACQGRTKIIPRGQSSCKA
jgi:hypothetical protein